MKQKFILHIPTGLYFNYAYYPVKDTEVHCILTEQFQHRKDDTHNFQNLYTSWKNNAKFFVLLEHPGIEYSISFNEFELVEIEALNE